MYWLLLDLTAVEVNPEQVLKSPFFVEIGEYLDLLSVHRVFYVEELCGPPAIARVGVGGLQDLSNLLSSLSQHGRLRCSFGLETSRVARQVAGYLQVIGVLACPSEERFGSTRTAANAGCGGVDVIRYAPTVKEAARKVVFAPP